MSETKNFKLNYAGLGPSLLYGLATGVRNLLYNWDVLHSKEYPIPVICVGNLAAGGTGKTPHTEYLVQLLKPHYRVAVLSRGYKRQTKGFRLAGANDTARTIGDEPYQMKRKFPDVLIAVDANRGRGIRHLMELPEEQKPEVVLLDDAFQHRSVLPSFSILLTDYHRLYYKDRLLPLGRLRETKENMRRANLIIVTKCEADLRPIDFRVIAGEMKPLPYQALYFSRLVYGETRAVFPQPTENPTAGNYLNAENEALLLAGVASPQPFIEEAQRRFGNVHPMIFADHHVFDKQDIRKIKDAFNRLNSPDKFILVTEKDAARLLHNPFFPEEWKPLTYYLPVAIDFCTKTTLSFDDCIRKHILTFQRNNIFH
ncbi:MAG: tetraacyldisaccharide 4'-kinase [Tannerellaceae bacterium]|jgi:tetraacyldisaccharide 4'-kinase|nr:tetraacyldisaccharide 4'-kinase [Tannerellaceae bacterium]